MRENKKNKLWYRQPAGQWIEALPVGNGRIGAMVYGGTVDEKIQIDESSFWSGAHSDENNISGTRELMEQIRAALLKKDYEMADRLGHGFVGKKNQYGTNMPVGELTLCIQGRKASEVNEMERNLDIEKGVAETVFKIEDHFFSRECFVSNPDQVFCLKQEADTAFDMDISYKGIDNSVCLKTWKDGEGQISGEAWETLHSDGRHGVHLEGILKIITDGTLEYRTPYICIRKATYVHCFIDMETNMFQKIPGELARKRVRKAVWKGYEACKRAHIADVKRLFDRVDIFLGEEEKNEIPTDIRIQRVSEGKEDLALYALMYQFGRYVLIASSRADSPLPTHMGGIWNDNIYNNIDCTQDMHIDMNLQMQYWASGMCGLKECYQPFFNYMKEILIPSGTKTAREEYGAEGWTAHVVSNPWGFTSLGWEYNWGAWSLGGVWCATLIWDYYEYTQDREFLENKGFPMLYGAVSFVLDYVFKDEKSGYYMTGPSYSPENQFSVDGKNYFLALSNTCDVILVREILEEYKKVLEVLEKKEDSQRLEKINDVLIHLVPYQIGKHGQIQEWMYDFEEPIPNHRHTSHLLGLYPFWQIRSQTAPNLARAAEKTIERRWKNYEITSWGLNMFLGYYARLHEGEKALGMIQEIFKRIVRCNMASVMSDQESMWMGTWEIDGNTGLTAAMTEMIVQCVENEIILLPALPKEWKQGYLRGIFLKGAGTADIYWRDGRLEYADIRFTEGKKRRICYEEHIFDKMFPAGEKVRITM